MSGLTPRQRSIFEFLRGYVRDRGYPPTIREIRDAFHLKSNRGVIDHLKALERKGFIKRVPGSSRAIEITVRPELPVDACENGSLVLVLVEGEAAVKRFMRAGGRIVLHAANPKDEPIVLSDADSHECAIVGTVVGVIRSLASHRGAFSG